MAISLKSTLGDGKVRLKAGQTFNPSLGVGAVSSVVNINSSTSVFSLSGEYTLQSLQLSGVGTTGTLVLTINIDGAVVYTGSVPITSDTVVIFNAPVNIESSISVTAQKTGVTSCAVSAVAYATL